MTPARRAKLQAAIDLIQSVTQADAWEMRADVTHLQLLSMGASLVHASGTYTFTLEGVTALCAFDNGEHLLTRWAANARRAIEEGAD